MIITTNMRNPQHLKSLFKKIYRGLYKITDIKLEYKIGLNNNVNDVKYSDVLSNDYKFLVFEVGHVPEKYQKKVIRYLNNFKKNIEDKNIVMSYYESCYDLSYDIITGERSGERDIVSYYKIYVKDAMGVRVKPPKYVYHTSPIKNRDKIKTEGVKTSYPVNFKLDGHDLDYMPSVFAVVSKDDVWRYGDIWQIDTSKINSKWWEDLNLYNSTIWGGNAIMTLDDIPPDVIELYIPEWE